MCSKPCLWTHMLMSRSSLVLCKQLTLKSHCVYCGLRSLIWLKWSNTQQEAGDRCQNMKQPLRNPPHIYKHLPTKHHRNSSKIIFPHWPPYTPTRRCQQTVFEWSTRDLMGGGLWTRVKNRNSFPAVVQLKQNKFSSSKHDLTLLKLSKTWCAG